MANEAKKFVFVSDASAWNDASASIMEQSGAYFKSIVFRKDTHEIYNRGQVFGGSAAGQEATDASIKDALEYNNDFGDLTTPSAVGGIKAGTKASDLNGKPVDELLSMLLFPEINPTVVAPSATTTFTNSSFKSNGLYEVNSTLPQEADLGYTFNRGKITVPGLADKNRAGAATGATYAVSGATTSFTPTTFAAGTYTYKATVSYGVGEEALTSYSNHATVDVNGSSISNPLPAGSVLASGISVTGVYPIYASSATAGTLAKQALTSSKSAVGLTMVGGASQVFAIKGTASKIMEYNSVSGKYDIDKKSGYTSETVTLQSGGSDVSYTKYTRTDPSGEDIKVQVTFS